MNRKIVILDLVLYAAIPFLIWNYGRESIGDYLAILLSTVPAFIYTVYRFVKEKSFNIMGLAIITSLLISTAVNLLSISAESMLWNQVYVGFSMAGIFLLSTLIRKPLALFFAVDILVLQGHLRQGSKQLFNMKGIFVWFQLMNILFVCRFIFLNGLKVWLLQTYGVEGYNKMIIYMTISSWIFSGLIFIGFIYISNKIGKFTEELKRQGKIEMTATEE